MSRSNTLPSESRALRREIYVALIAFFVGWIGTLIVLGWLIVRFVVPEGRGWDILHACINAILISIVFGGMGLATLSLLVMNWYHYRRGFYHCLYCDRKLKSAKDRCGCRGHLPLS